MYNITPQEKKVIDKHGISESHYSIKKMQLAAQKGCTVAALSEITPEAKKMIYMCGISEADYQETRLATLAEEAILGY